MVCVRKEPNVLSCIPGENDLYFHSLWDSHLNYVIFNRKIFTERVFIEVKSWLRTLSIIGDAGLSGRADVPRNDLLCWDRGLVSSREQDLVGNAASLDFPSCRPCPGQTQMSAAVCVPWRTLWHQCDWMAEKSCQEQLIWLVFTPRLWVWVLLGALFEASRGAFLPRVVMFGLQQVETHGDSL